MTNKCIMLTLAACATLATFPNEAHAKNVRGSTGIGIGSSRFNYGLSLKHYMGDAAAVQVLVGSGWGYDLGIDADYLIEMPAIANPGPVEVAWNVGGGLGIDFWNRSYRTYYGRSFGGRGFGVRAAFVAGLEFNLHFIDALPIDLVLEWRPSIQVIPEFYFTVDNFAGNLRLYLF